MSDWYCAIFSSAERAMLRFFIYNSASEIVCDVRNEYRTLGEGLQKAQRGVVVA
jgi:hypothetical protein